MRDEGAPESLASLALAVLFPLGEASRANRAVRARRPEVGGPRPAFRDHEIAHWRAMLEGSPTLGAVVDEIYAAEAARTRAALAAAQRILGAAGGVAAVLLLAVALPAIGEIFAVSLWLLVAAVYALLASFAGVRAVRSAHFLTVGLDEIEDPIERARVSRGEQARGVLLTEVRARRACAAAHDQAASDCIDNLVAAAGASLRNAFVAASAWIVLDVAPSALATAWRGLARTLGS